VTKEEIIREVWPDTFVEETSLRVNIAALRKALADGRDGRRYIVNIPGRGYCFTAPVSCLNVAPFFEAKIASTPSASNLPTRITRVIGRDDVVATVSELLAEHRFVTIVGPGGIGKTTVALAIAPKLASRYEHGVRFIDLAPLADSQLVSTASIFRARVTVENSFFITVGLITLAERPSADRHQLDARRRRIPKAGRVRAADLARRRPPDAQLRLQTHAGSEVPGKPRLAARSGCCIVGDRRTSHYT
jgi:hypothetical protein